MSRVPPVLLVAILGACAADATTRNAVVRDSAGIAIVEIHASLPDEGALQLGAEPLVDIGVVDGAPEYQFYRVVGAGRLSDGRIAVLNAGTQQVRFYDADGRYLSASGGQGGGPGELRYPAHLQIATGDSIIVWEGPLGPRSVFDAAGAYVDRLTLDRAMIMAGLATHFSEGFTPLDGESVLLTAYERQREDFTLRDDLFRPVLGYLRVSFDGTRIDTLGWYGGIPQKYVDVGGSRRPVTMMLGYHAQVAAGGRPLRIYTGDTERFDIRVFDDDARLLRIIRRTAPPPPIDPQHVELVRRERLEWAEQRSGREEMERMLAVSPVAPHYPAFSGLRTDVHGRLWVEEYAPPGSDTTRLTAFDDDGREAGTIALPPSFRPLEIGDDYILGVFTDDLDVEHIRMYPLTRR